MSIFQTFVPQYILPLTDERNSHGMESLLRLENKISDTVN